jgi:hypothetical protein
MKGRYLVFLIILLPVLVTGCDRQEQADQVDSWTVVESYLEAINAGKIDSALTYIVDNATLQYPDAEILLGKEDIKEFLKSNVDGGLQIDFSKRNCSVCSPQALIKAWETWTLDGETKSYSCEYYFKAGEIIMIKYLPAGG